jgi:hypothetical protein
MRERLNFVYSEGVLKDFKRVCIKDLNKFKVPSTLESNYKGCGGDIHASSQAGISIRYEYDLKSGEITDLNITSGNRNDRTDAGETAQNVSAGDLIIRDLGYFSTAVFETISEGKAFFFIPSGAGIHVYDSENKQLSFDKIYREMQKRALLKRNCRYLSEKNSGWKCACSCVWYRMKREDVTASTCSSPMQGKIFCRWKMFFPTYINGLPVESVSQTDI